MARPSGQKHSRVVERITPLHRRSTLARVERDDSQLSRSDQSADAHAARIVWRGMSDGDLDVHIARIGPEGRVSLERIR
jgi:hypothetical protein